MAISKRIAPPATYNYCGVGIKGEEVAENKLARSLLMVREVDLADSTPPETEDDEGHTGTGSLKMETYRKTAHGEPSFTDKIRFCEGFEEFMYALLGNNKKEPYSHDGSEVPNVFKYTMDFPIQSAEELPFLTLYRGFSLTQKDGYTWNNAMLNSMELSTPREEKPTINYSFMSDFRNFRLINPARIYVDKIRWARGENVKWFIGDIGASEADMRNNPLTCLEEASLNVNNNLDTPPCQGDEFGTTTKLIGERETTGSLTMPWNDATKELQYEFYNKDPNGHYIIEAIPHKQLWCEITSTVKIPGTDINYSVLYKMPDVEFTSAEDVLSGSDPMNISIEYSVNETPFESFLTTEIITDLPNLRIDTTGIPLSDLY